MGFDQEIVIEESKDAGSPILVITTPIIACNSIVRYNRYVHNRASYDVLWGNIEKYIGKKYQMMVEAIVNVIISGVK